MGEAPSTLENLEQKGLHTHTHFFFLPDIEASIVCHPSHRPCLQRREKVRGGFACRTPIQARHLGVTCSAARGNARADHRLTSATARGGPLRSKGGTGGHLSDRFELRELYAALTMCLSSGRCTRSPHPLGGQLCRGPLRGPTAIVGCRCYREAGTTPLKHSSSASSL